MKERKAFKKNKGLVKRLFSFVLALALVLNMGQIMPAAVVEAAESYDVTFHYYNQDNWSGVNLWAWNDGGANFTGGTWPGKAMTPDTERTGWYDITITGVDHSALKFIFSGSGKQTADLSYNLTSSSTELWVTGGHSTPVISATAPTGYYPAPETYGATIHYYNNLDWNAVAFYAWDSANTALAAWPGSVVAENADHEGWYDATVSNFAESSINVIFNNNNNGGQTADLTVDLTADEVWVINGEVLTTAPNAWTGEGEIEKPYELTFHYLNDRNYGSVNFYSWTAGTNAGAWPGVAMSANADHEGWYDYKVVGVSPTSIDFILNHAGGQTDDLKVNISGKPAEVWVTGELQKGKAIAISTTAPENWEKAPEVEPPVVEPTTYDATIHYHNMYNWDTVAFYSWGTVTPAPAWPGSVVLENTEKEGWYTVTVTDFAEPAINVIFNNNNNGGQTGDLAVDLTAGEEFWVYNGEVLATAPNAWTGEGEIEKPYELVFHYYDQKNYGAVNFYSWTAGTNAGSWPGVAMEKNADHTGWFDYKVVGVTAASIDFILNYTGGQTNDLKLDISDKPVEVWVTGELQKGKAISISKEAPEGWVEIEEDPTYNATIHYLNSDEWSAVSFYAWGSDNVGFLTWPGKAISENEDHEGWFDATVETKESSIGVIFNNGGNGGQTGDLTVDLTAGDEFWVMYGTVYTEAPNAWTGEGEAEEPEFEEITFHYENKNGWSVVNFYSWTGGTNAGSWPGVAMTPNEEKLGWYDFTVRNITASSIDFILNNGSAQTADLNVDISGKPSDIWVTGYYNNPVISTTAPETWENPGEVVVGPSAYNVVVHYNNPNNWSQVAFYSWNSAGNAIVGGWPGTAATANVSNTGWYDFYLNGLTDSVFNFIWNENGAGGQTADLVYTLTEESTELWVSGESISTTAPAGWKNTYAVKFHFKNTNNWSNVSLYTWDGNNNNFTGGWPGTAATANESNEGWFDYSLTNITTADFNFIFNGTGGQTADLKYTFTKPYTELWVVGNTVSDKQPEEWSNKVPVKERDVYVPGTLPGPAWDAASNKMEYLGNGIYKFELKNVPAANYEYKIAIGGTWDENYGANGAANGGNIKLIVPYAQDVTIYYSDVTHFAVDTINYIFADITLSGKNVPEGTKLADEGLTGIYNVTVKLPAGTYTDLKLEYNGVTYTFSKFTLAKEKEVTFCMDPLSGLFYHDGSATKVKASALYFDSKSTEYKSVFGAVATGEEVKFSLTTGDDVTSASLFFKGMENKAIAMSKDGEVVNGKQKWSVTTSLSAIGEYDYYFAVSNGADVCVYGDDDGYYGTGKTSGLTDVMPYDLVVYKAGFTTPDWMKNGVIYQIFPDRFFDGNPNNNQAQTSARGDVDYEFIEDWSVIPENPEQEDLLDEETYKSTGAYYGDRNWSNEIYGGDIKGITQRIDYLKALGVTVIYLNPVFHSISSHRYDACDYTKIDPILGTEGDFTELVTIAEANGMTVVLDGVFNHVSDDSIYFDRYYKFIDDGLDTIGAYPYWAYVYDYMAEKGVSQSTAEAAAKQYFSRTYGISDFSYVEWFYVSSEYMTDGKGGTVKDKIGQRAGKPVYTYEGWWGYDSMPVIKSTNGSEYQTGNWAEDIIYNEEGTSVTQYWISRGMDGWRLDVANEVSDETWQAFRESVKALDSEAVIIGEIWDDATKYILGDMYDSVMNYQFRNAVTSFAMGSDAATVTKQMEKIRERYPQEAFYAMMNLVGSHDTSRILSYLDGIGDDRNDKSIDAAFPTYEKTSALAKQRQYLVAFLQFTYAGAPTIYYGDEVGVVGCDDPDDRRTFPWGQGAEELVTYYATLAQIRSAYPALRTGSVETISTGNSKVMGYVRAEGEEVVVVLANNATSTQKVVVDVAKYGITASQLQDMLGGAVYAVADGKVTVNVPALKGVILVEEAKTISVDVDALAPAFDEEAAKRPVAPAPTPTPTPNPNPTPSTPSVPETPEEPTTEETPEVAPEEEVEDEEDVEVGEDILIMPPVDTEDEDTTQAPEEETETETDKPAATDIPKEEKPVEEVVADSEEAWTEIINKVVENEGKANITVQVTENTQVPASFIQAIAGQNIDVVIEMPNGIVWTISSDTVNGEAVDVNFHVDVDSHNIPTDVVNELAEDKPVIQISLAHSGEFGCHPVLTVPVGAENAGKYANLFYFNEETGVMEFMTYGLIGEDGKVDLQFVHASEYAIVIDTQFMGTVIDSVDTPLADIDAGPSPLIFILLIVCVAVGAVAVCYGLRKKEDRA